MDLISLIIAKNLLSKTNGGSGSGIKKLSYEFEITLGNESGAVFAEPGSITAGEPFIATVIDSTVYEAGEYSSDVLFLPMGMIVDSVQMNGWTGQFLHFSEGIRVLVATEQELDGKYTLVYQWSDWIV